MFVILTLLFILESLKGCHNYFVANNTDIVVCTRDPCCSAIYDERNQYVDCLGECSERASVALAIVAGVLGGGIYLTVIVLAIYNCVKNRNVDQLDFHTGKLYYQSRTHYSSFYGSYISSFISFGGGALATFICLMYQLPFPSASGHGFFKLLFLFLFIGFGFHLFISIMLSHCLFPITVWSINTETNECFVHCNRSPFLCCRSHRCLRETDTGDDTSLFCLNIKRNFLFDEIKRIYEYDIFYENFSEEEGIAGWRWALQITLDNDTHMGGANNVHLVSRKFLAALKMLHQQSIINALMNLYTDGSNQTSEIYSKKVILISKLLFAQMCVHEIKVLGLANPSLGALERLLVGEVLKVPTLLQDCVAQESDDPFLYGLPGTTAEVRAWAEAQRQAEALVRAQVRAQTKTPTQTQTQTPGQTQAAASSASSSASLTEPQLPVQSLPSSSASFSVSSASSSASLIEPKIPVQSLPSSSVSCSVSSVCSSAFLAQPQFPAQNLPLSVDTYSDNDEDEKGKK